MRARTRLVALVAALVLMLHVTPSWGGTINPTDSDVNNNTAGGLGALFSVVPGVAGGQNNTAFGRSALQSTTTGSGNTATGAFALIGNTTGNSNTASGYAALQNNTTGSSNTATGIAALGGDNTGDFNTANGTQALTSNTEGSRNTATGTFALANNTTGNENTASGDAALYSNTTGSNNTASGGFALYSNDIGTGNTASGFQALQSNTAGTGNTAVGFKTLKKSTGTKNIAIGYQAGVTLTTGNNNIYIGNQGASVESQTIRIGAAQTSTFVAGVNGTSLSGGGTAVIIDANGQLGTTVSSARYKRDIAPMGARSAAVHQLRPVTFAYQNDASGTLHHGLIAEEVAAVYPELVTHQPTGEVQAVRYLELIPMLLNELQRQRLEFQHALQQQQLEFQQALHQQQRAVAELRAQVGQVRGGETLIPGTPIALGEAGTVPR